MRERADSAVLLGDHVACHLDVIVDDLIDRQWHEVPELWVTDDPALRHAVARSTRENVELMVGALRQPMGAPFALSPGARLEADTAARCDVQIDALLRTYRLGQQAMTEHFLDAIASGGVDDPPSAIRQLRAATRTVHDYMDAVMPLVWREYDEERDRLRSHPDLSRLRLVQAALAGSTDVALEYDPAGAHVAIVAADPGAEAAISAVGAALGVATLAVRASDTRCWAWLATTDAGEVVARLRAETLDGAAGVGGPAGFRAAHRQAMLAERIARMREAGIVDIQSAALEALALGDQRTAGEVARAELGPLVDLRNDHLVATLEAWFAARESIARTAAAVGIAPRTVSYRLRRAETLLGHPIAHRRAELEAALRLQRLFAGAPPPL